MHADTCRLTQPWPFYYIRHGSQLVLWPQVLLSWEDVAHSCADGNISLRILVKNAHPSCTLTEYSSWKPLLITQCNSLRTKQYKNNERKPIIKPLCEPLYNSGIHHFVMLWQCSSSTFRHKGPQCTPILVDWLSTPCWETPSVLGVYGWTSWSV